MNWQGYLVVAALIVLLVLGVLARRWTRNFARKAQENLNSGLTADKAGIGVVDRTITALATVARFEAPVERVAVALDPVKLPMFWTRPEPARWVIELAKGDPTPATVAILEPDGTGSRLALVRAQESAGVPTSEPDWRKLRTRALETARAAGIDAVEQPGPALVRTPRVDTTGMSAGEAARVPHFFERPGYFSTQP